MTLRLAITKKYDGTGYPHGLRHDEIPLCSRIVALSDVYDALTTARVYKPAYSHEWARNIILEGNGSHFDPDIVAAFLAVEEQFIRDEGATRRWRRGIGLRGRLRNSAGLRGRQACSRIAFCWHETVARATKNC